MRRRRRGRLRRQRRKRRTIGGGRTESCMVVKLVWLRLSQSPFLCFLRQARRSSLDAPQKFAVSYLAGFRGEGARGQRESRANRSEARGSMRRSRKRKERKQTSRGLSRKPRRDTWARP
ncbi:hypothetical protein TGMAS_416010 [Toxoplasma gondii MAS]|uniref:Uncharacterized protein n=1 Tax=Toxoplasma gondii MAS TaxID=943118 RepID=A0A086Q1I1_TOXGO|nr:hypothetical protein TGMAS_416010 [Toxoplasma gondii MAS]